ncbi:hypothetical protein DFH09DRAFT_324709 [Mycena vulgaris]|nr:hypothetical protein DFH09DRAFT_324709 [Mycena vulgaris]
MLQRRSFPFGYLCLGGSNGLSFQSSKYSESFLRPWYQGASPISTLVMRSCNLSLLFSFCTGFRHFPGTVLRSRGSQLMSKPTHHLGSSMGIVSSSLHSLYPTGECSVYALAMLSYFPTDLYSYFQTVQLSVNLAYFLLQFFLFYLFLCFSFRRTPTFSLTSCR